MKKEWWREIADSREPDMELPGRLKRWCLFPIDRTGPVSTLDGMGIAYLHQLTGPDQPIYHGHPWSFTSIVLKGAYLQAEADVADLRLNPEKGLEVERQCGDCDYYELHADGRQTAHYIMDTSQEVWTLVLARAPIMSWGFYPDPEYVFVRSDIFLSSHLNDQGPAIFRNGYQLENV